MRKLLWGLLIWSSVLLFSDVYDYGITYSRAAGITKIVGASSDCTDACEVFPSTVTILCDGSGTNVNCPQFFHPDWTDTTFSRFYGITNRTNPPLCVTSSDGGTSWGTCSSHPYTGTLTGFGASLAVASNGALIAVAAQGSNTCIIRRSTDGGTSWGTVYTSTSINCYVVVPNPSYSILHCSETGGYCVVFDTLSSTQYRAVYSTDNGATWTEGSVISYVGTNSAIIVALSKDGSIGAATSVINPTTGRPFMLAGGGDFRATTNNYVPPVNQNCSAIIMNTVRRAVCTRNGTSDSTLRYVNLADSPTELGTLTISGLPNAQTIRPVGYSSSIGYLVQIDTVSASRVSVYVTIDNWNSIHLLGKVTPTSIPISACCRGNIIRWGNAIYFTSGSVGSTAFFIRIQ